MRTYTHRIEVVTAGLNSLNEEAACSRVAVNCTDKILYRRLMGKVNEVTNVVDNQPGQMLRIVQVLTLNKQQKYTFMSLSNTFLMNYMKSWNI